MALLINVCTNIKTLGSSNLRTCTDSGCRWWQLEMEARRWSWSRGWRSWDQTVGRWSFDWPATAAVYMPTEMCTATPFCSDKQIHVLPVTINGLLTVSVRIISKYRPMLGIHFMIVSIIIFYFVCCGKIKFLLFLSVTGRWVSFYRSWGGTQGTLLSRFSLNSAIPSVPQSWQTIPCLGTCNICVCGTAVKNLPGDRNVTK